MLKRIDQCYCSKRCHSKFSNRKERNRVKTLTAKEKTELTPNLLKEMIQTHGVNNIAIKTGYDRNKVTRMLRKYKIKNTRGSKKNRPHAKNIIKR